MTLLAGDLGGTKTLLALCDEHRRLLYTQRMASHEYRDLAAMVEVFLGETTRRGLERPTRAAFGVAGRVETLRPGADGGPEQRARITNLSFTIETAELRTRCGLDRALLCNDFYAVAAAIAVAAAPGADATDFDLVAPRG